jgi:hypothetical protein
MTQRFIVRPRAEDDIQAAFEWYESEQPGLGNEFLSSVRNALRAFVVLQNRVPRFTARSVARSFRDFRMSCSTSLSRRGSLSSPCSTKPEILAPGLVRLFKYADPTLCPVR